MMAAFRATLLGTGSSGGVPRIGGDWGVCDPKEPRNRRRRCSLLIESNGQNGKRPTRVLIDTSPDLREQLLDAGVGELDGLVFTHDHADQTHGIDDIRVVAINMRQPIATWLDEETARTLVPKFQYCFEGKGGYPAILSRQSDMQPFVPFTVDGPGGAVSLLPMRQQHGPIVSLGFRCGELAYCNDVSALPDESFEALSGVSVFIVDALRYTPHATHAHLERALDWIARVAPNRAILTNLHIDMDYQTLRNELPDGVEPAFDGMVVDFDAA